MHVRNNTTKFRKRLLRGLFLLFSILLSSQGFGTSSNPASSEWTLIKEVEGVSFYYQISDCSGNQVLMLRVVNGSAQKITGHWMLEISAGDSKLKFPGVLMPVETGSEEAANCTMQDPHLSIPMPALDMSSIEISIVATINPS